MRSTSFSNAIVRSEESQSWPPALSEACCGWDCSPATVILLSDGALWKEPLDVNERQLLLYENYVCILATNNNLSREAKTYLNQSCSIRDQTLSIIKIQIATRCTIAVKRHEQAIRRFSRLSGGQLRLLQHEDCTTPYVHVDMLEGRLQRDIFSRLSVDFGERVPVVPALAVANAGEHALHCLDVGYQYRGDEDGWAEHELTVRLAQRLVVGESV